MYICILQIFYFVSRYDSSAHNDKNTYYVYTSEAESGYAPQANALVRSESETVPSCVIRQAKREAFMLAHRQ
jgi:hypothetical protein